MSPPPPNYEFQEWWNKEREKAYGLLAPPPDDPSITSSSATGAAWATVEVSTPTTPAAAGKSRGRSPRQLSWLLFLRLHHSAALVASLPARILSLLLTAGRRISSAPVSSSADSRLYRAIRAFLFLAVFLLLLELLAYFKGWHFSPPSYASSAEALERLYANWLHIRA